MLEELQEKLSKFNYLLIRGSNNVGFVAIPKEPRALWTRLDTEEEVIAFIEKLKAKKDDEAQGGNTKECETIYTDECGRAVIKVKCGNNYTLKDYAINGLKSAGIPNCIVFGAKRGEHYCKVCCKENGVNLEKIVLDFGDKKICFNKFTQPFETEWSGSYTCYFKK